jgi:hypothetical protein
MMVQYVITIETDEESCVDPEGVWQYGLEPYIQDFMNDLTGVGTDVFISYKKQQKTKSEDKK